MRRLRRVLREPSISLRARCRCCLLRINCRGRCESTRLFVWEATSGSRRNRSNETCGEINGGSENPGSSSRCLWQSGATILARDRVRHERARLCTGHQYAEIAYESRFDGPLETPRFARSKPPRAASELECQTFKQLRRFEPQQSATQYAAPHRGSATR